MGPFTDNEIRDISIGVAWSLAMTISLIGWGGILCKVLGLKDRAEWIKGALGGGGFIVTAGLLDYLGAASRMNLVLMILSGLAIWAFTGGIRNLKDTVSGAGLAVVPMTGVALYIATLGSNSWMFDANWDDSSGYWPICEQISVTGTSWGPLSLRRALTWGGQFPLQTVGMLFTSTLGGYIYDRAVGSWLMLLCGLAGLKGKKSPALAAVAGSMLIVLPNTSVNSAPTVLAAVFLAACYVERKSPIGAAILMATTALTRTQLIPTAVMLGILAMVEIRKEKSAWAGIKYGMGAAGGTLLLCLPLLLLQKQMFDTYCVFLSAGTINTDYCTFIGSTANLGERFWTVLTSLTAVLGCLIGLVTVKKSRACGVIALITLCVMVVTMPEYSILEWQRYSWPVFTMATMVGIYLGWRKSTAPVLTVATVAMCGLPLWTLIAYQQKSVQSSEQVSAGLYPWQSQGKAQYKIPENKGIVFINLQPAMLDFKRNKVINWDSFPAVGNAPKTADAEAWRAWGKKIGAEYLVMTDFNARIGPNKKMYDLWIAGGGPATNLAHYQRVWFPDRKARISTLQELEQKLPRYRSNGQIILDLRPEGSPYELSIPWEAVEKDRKNEPEEDRIMAEMDANIQAAKMALRKAEAATGAELNETSPTTVGETPKNKKQ